MQDIQGTLELEVELKKLMNAFADRKTQPRTSVRSISEMHGQNGMTGCEAPRVCIHTLDFGDGVFQLEGEEGIGSTCCILH